MTAQNQLASRFQVKRGCHRLSGCPIISYIFLFSPNRAFAIRLFTLRPAPSQASLQRLLLWPFFSHLIGLLDHLCPVKNHVFVYIISPYQSATEDNKKAPRQTMSKVPEQLCASPAEKVPAYPRNGCIVWSKFMLLGLFCKDSESPVLANEFCVEGKYPPLNHKCNQQTRVSRLSRNMHSAKED